MDKLKWVLIALMWLGELALSTAGVVFLKVVRENFLDLNKDAGPAVLGIVIAVFFFGMAYLFHRLRKRFNNNPK